MLTHLHIVVYTWWCWHIYKGEEVGVDVDQLGEEKEAKQVTGSDWIAQRIDRTLAGESGHVFLRRRSLSQVTRRWPRQDRRVWSVAAERA